MPGGSSRHAVGSNGQWVAGLQLGAGQFPALRSNRLLPRMPVWIFAYLRLPKDIFVLGLANSKPQSFVCHSGDLLPTATNADIFYIIKRIARRPFRQPVTPKSHGPDETDHGRHDSESPLFTCQHQTAPSCTLVTHVFAKHVKILFRHHLPSDT